jgi:hypothetical protein
MYKKYASSLHRNLNKLNQVLNMWSYRRTTQTTLMYPFPPYLMGRYAARKWKALVSQWPNT